MRTLLAALALAGSASAQSFQFADFSSTNELVFNENALVAGNVLRVTAAGTNERGAVYWEDPVPVADGFDTTFVFQFSALSGGGADGMTFIIQNDVRGTAAIGEAGTELGYAAVAASGPGIAISNSLVVEMDTWFSAGSLDLSANEVSMHTNGPDENMASEDFSLANASPATNLSDGAPHTMRIVYASGVIDVYLDDLVTPLLSAAYDFDTGGMWNNLQPVDGLDLINDTSAYVGFTSGTGGAWENHDVLSWDWESGSLATSYCTSVPNSSGVAATISASGSASLANDDLLLISDGLPPGEPGIFYYGPDALQVPFGDGFRCVGGAGGTVVRIFPFVMADPAGHAERTLSNTNPTHAPFFLAGATLRFQAWYRDPLAGMSGFNLSDGIEVTLTP